MTSKFYYRICDFVSFEKTEQFWHGSLEIRPKLLEISANICKKLQVRIELGSLKDLIYPDGTLDWSSFVLLMKNSFKILDFLNLIKLIKPQKTIAIRFIDALLLADREYSNLFDASTCWWNMFNILQQLCCLLMFQSWKLDYRFFMKSGWGSPIHSRKK